MSITTLERHPAAVATESMTASTVASSGQVDPPIYTISQAARLLGVTVRTLYRWDKGGKLHVKHTPGGHRRFSENEIERLRVFVRRRHV